MNHRYHQPNTPCMVTHAEGDLDGYNFDITYNKHGDPATLTANGIVSIMEYDTKNRLIKTSFGNGVHFDFIYSNNTFLPSVSNYYHPLFGGLIAIDSFRYNLKGELIKWTKINARKTSYNSSFIYEYDNNGNVKKVISQAEAGGTEIGAPYIEFSASEYDHHYNFISGNHWIKYILLHTYLQACQFMIFSVNNAIKWHWNSQSISAPTLYFTSDMEYDDQGFANKITMHVSTMKDGGYNDWTFVRRSTSTCNPALKSNSMQHAKLLSLDENMVKRDDQIPSPFSK